MHALNINFGWFTTALAFPERGTPGDPEGGAWTREPRPATRKGRPGLASPYRHQTVWRSGKGAIWLVNSCVRRFEMLADENNATRCAAQNRFSARFVANRRGTTPSTGILASIVFERRTKSGRTYSKSSRLQLRLVPRTDATGHRASPEGRPALRNSDRDRDASRKRRSRLPLLFRQVGS